MRKMKMFSCNIKGMHHCLLSGMIFTCFFIFMRTVIFLKKTKPKNTCVREDTVQHKINSLFKYSIGMMNIITDFLCKTQLYYFRYYWIFTFLALVPQFSLIFFSSTQIIIFWLLGKANSPVRLESLEGLKAAVVVGQQSRMEWDGRLWETSETGKWKTEQIS